MRNIYRRRKADRADIDCLSERTRSSDDARPSSGTGWRSRHVNIECRIWIGNCKYKCGGVESASSLTKAHELKG